MARYCGKVGYATTYEKSPGVWIDGIVERQYYGNVDRYKARWESSGNVNDDMLINNEFSIIADAFAYENFMHMKYIEFMGALWKITSVEVQRPRLIIIIGGLWNGEQADSPTETGDNPGE